jgi:hypothetical protein
MGFENSSLELETRERKGGKVAAHQREARAEPREVTGARSPVGASSPETRGSRQRVRRARE